jgi:hypothetical protein
MYLGKMWGTSTENIYSTIRRKRQELHEGGENAGAQATISEEVDEGDDSALVQEPLDTQGEDFAQRAPA